jgi:predicted nuclease of predicted toxin-antitoxin system
VRFLIDMPLSPRLAAWLQEQGHDAVHALDLGMDRSPDPDILSRALKDDRVVITADLDFPRLLALEHAEGPGLILFREGDYSEAESLERLRATLSVVPEAELPGSIIVVQRDRIRRRRLPLT